MTQEEIKRFSDKLIKRVNRFLVKNPKARLTTWGTDVSPITGDFYKNREYPRVCLLMVINYGHPQPKEAEYQKAAALNLNISESEAFRLEQGFMNSPSNVFTSEYKIGKKVRKYFEKKGILDKAYI